MCALCEKAVGRQNEALHTRHKLQMFNGVAVIVAMVAGGVFLSPSPSFFFHIYICKVFQTAYVVLYVSVSGVCNMFLLAVCIKMHEVCKVHI